MTLIDSVVPATADLSWSTEKSTNERCTEGLVEQTSRSDPLNIYEKRISSEILQSNKISTFKDIQFKPVYTFKMIWCRKLVEHQPKGVHACLCIFHGQINSLTDTELHM